MPHSTANESLLNPVTVDLSEFDTAGDFLKSELFMGIITQCGHRIVYCEKEVAANPTDGFWMDKLAAARLCYGAAIAARTRATIRGF